MTGTFDRRLRALAEDAAAAHLGTDGLTTATIRARVERGRRTRAVVTGAVSLGAVAAVLAIGIAAAGAGPSRPLPAQTPTQTSTTSPTPSPSSASRPTPDPADTGPVVQGWRDAAVPTDVFGRAWITDAVVLGDRTVVVGCDAGAFSVGGETTFGVWVGTDPTTWRAVAAPADQPDPPTECLDSVVASPHGLYAHGQGLYRSPDGEAWERVDTEAWAGTGWVDAVAVIGDRVTVIMGHAAEAETSVARLHTTTDGVTWTQVDPTVAEVFDNARVAQVLEGGDGLLAVGAWPGGEAVPTATAWTSADGMSWRRVTPGGPGFDECSMSAVSPVPQGFVAVGGCPFAGSEMASWTSQDGLVWTRDAPHEGEDLTVDVAASATRLVQLGDVLYATAEDANARGLEPTARGMWRRTADGRWVRHRQDPLPALPMAQTAVGGTTVGFWRDAGPTRVLVPDR